MGGVNNIPVAIVLVLVNTALLFSLLIVYAVQYPLRYIQRRLLSNRRRPPRARVFVTTNESQREGDATDTIVLVHGFPDGPALWRATVTRLTELGYRCLVVALPGCRGQQVEQPLEVDVIVSQLHDAIVGELETAQAAQREGRQEENKHGQSRRQKKQSVTVIAHDWGVPFTQFLQSKYPSLVHRVVCLDVGQIDIMRMDFVWKASFISYQMVLACCYLLGNPIGTLVLRVYVTLVFRYDGRPPTELRSDMAWMYVTFLYFYLSVAKKQKQKTGVQQSGQVNNDNKNDDDDNNKASSSSSSSPSCSTTRPSSGSSDMSNSNRSSLTSTIPRLGSAMKIPTLFIYGRHKPFKFHEDRYVERVRSLPHGVAEGWDCGHWIQLEKEAEWLSTLGKWLESTRHAVSGDNAMTE